MLNEKMSSLAIVAGDEAQEGWGLVGFYMHCCQVLIEADMASIEHEELGEFVAIALKRRQDRFPSVPILNQVGIYAT